MRTTEADDVVVWMRSRGHQAHVSSVEEAIQRTSLASRAIRPELQHLLYRGVSLQSFARRRYAALIQDIYECEVDKGVGKVAITIFFARISFLATSCVSRLDQL
jgi:hypothetical protein